jgi:polyhydroxyalkanoate synthesis regulator phasin
MKDRQTQSDDWIGEWIARQRDTLAQQANRANESTDANPADILRRWIEAGQAYFDGRKKQGSQPDQEGRWGFGDPFNINNALMGAWASAGLFRSSVAQQTSELLGRLPPIGLAREQTEAWRELAAAHARCEQIENELRAVLLKVQFDALDLLSERVRQRKPGQPIDSFRTLYDLWVECGEQVYNKLAHSDAYSKLQAELGNATMRVRSRAQVVVEHWLKQMDLPTRSELNSLHRQVRELRLQVEQLTARPQTLEKSRPKRATSALAPKRKAPVASKRKVKSRRQ